MRFADIKASCEQASIFYYDYISGGANDIEPLILSHIEKCTFCNSEIERLKAVLSESADQTANDAIIQKNKLITTILASHFRLADKEVTCGIAKQFMPSLANPLVDLRVPTPITAHIESCPLCKHDFDVICELKLTDEQLTRFGQVLTIQALECSQDVLPGEIGLLEKMGVNSDTLKALKQILERQESGVVTEYRTQKEISASDCNNTSPQNSVIVRNSHTGGYNFVRKLAKPLIATAALLLIGVLFFVGTFANAIEYDDVYNAISKIQNVCLVTGESVTREPTQEIWVSNALNIKLFHSGSRWIFWDIENKIRKIQVTGSDSSEVGNLNDAEIVNIKQGMNIPLGVLPFQSYSALPEKYSWKLSSDDKAILQIRNTCIYDLLWAGKTANDKSIHYKWRAYIDKDTMLPKRVENWRKQSTDEQYKLTGWTNITYPTTQEVENLVHSIAFIGK